MRSLYVSAATTLPAASTSTPRRPLNPPFAGFSAGDGRENRYWPPGANTWTRKLGLSPTQMFPSPATVTSRPPSENSPPGVLQHVVCVSPPGPPIVETYAPERVNRYTLSAPMSTTYTAFLESSTARPRRLLFSLGVPLFPNWNRYCPDALNTSTRLFTASAT